MRRTFLLVLLTVPVLFPGQASAQKIVNMELVGQLGLGASPICSIQGVDVRVNDVWGYDAPDGTALALVGLCDGTAIVDVTDPTAPSLLTTIAGPRSVWRDIKTFGTHAYIVHDNIHSSDPSPAPVGVQIVDLADPAFPVVATLTDGFNRGHNLFIDVTRGHLYVADWKPGSGNGIRIYDLNASATAPPFLGQWNGCNVHDLSVQGTVAYLACLSQGLWFVDVSDPAAPVTLDSFTYSQDTNGSPLANFTHNVWPSTDGSFVVVTDEQRKQRVKFIDVTSLASPSVVNEYEALPDILAHNAFVQGDFTYLSYYSEGAVILESSDPTEVCELGYYDTYPFAVVGPSTADAERGAWGIYPYTASGLIYVSDISTGLYVLRFDPPSRDPVDLSLVLDVSGSMASTAIGGTAPKIDVLKDAVELLIETWRPFTVPGDHLGVVYFETAVQTDFINGSISTPFCPHHAEFVTSVRARSTGNLTAMGGGLLTAVRAFGDPLTRQEAILVTDGMQNVSPMVVDAGLEAIFFDLGNTLISGPPNGPWTLFPDAQSTVTELKARGVRLGIITNVPPGWTRTDLEDRMADPDFLDEFEVVLLSSEAPAAKPDPAIFTHALSLLTGPPPVSHVAFVTETLDHLAGTDGMGQPVGAQAVGMVGIHLSTAAPDPSVDHTVPDLASITGIVDASSTPSRHEVLTVPTGSGVFAESGVPGEPGTTLAQLGPTVHTIGIGTTPGTKWQELIEDIATETGGLHHFTSEPDADLLNFLEDDLVMALQTGSVYRVARGAGRLGRGESDTLRFALNPTVSKLLVRVSWPETRGQGLLLHELGSLDPSGQPGSTIPPSNRRLGTFFEVATWEFPVSLENRPLEPAGSWQLRIRRSPALDSLRRVAVEVPYSVSVLVDDGLLKAGVSVPRGPFLTGEAIPIQARFALGDAPLSDVDVRVSVTGPASGLGSLLVEMGGPRRPGTTGTEGFDPIELRLAELVQDSSFRNRLSPRTGEIVLSDQGDGSYLGALTDTRTPGSYRFDWTATGTVDGEPFRRSGTFVRAVRVGAFGESPIVLDAIRLDDGRSGIRVTVTPIDRWGNHLGPGYADRISVAVPGVPAPVRPEDALDGSYVAEVAIEPSESLYDASVLLLGERLPLPSDQVDRIVRRGFDRPDLSLHAGWAWPHSGFAAPVDAGPALALDGHWPITPSLKAGARLNWALFDDGGGGTLDLFSAHAEVQVRPFSALSSWTPVIELGAGPDVIDWDSVELGMHLGAGVQFRLGGIWVGEIAYRYFNTLADGPNLEFSEAQLGVLFTPPD